MGPKTPPGLAFGIGAWAPMVDAGEYTTRRRAALDSVGRILTTPHRDMNSEAPADRFLRGLDDLLADLQQFPGAAWDPVTGLARRTITA